MKTCKKCGSADRHPKWGYCQPCRREYERRNPRTRNKDERRRANAKYRYSLLPSELASMYEQQGHRCFTCGRHENDLSTKLNVDHDHDTGKIRGLLCGDCNRALGLIRDSVPTLHRMAEYLTMQEP